jgi:hypothetical protein
MSLGLIKKKKAARSAAETGKVFGWGKDTPGETSYKFLTIDFAPANSAFLAPT